MSSGERPATPAESEGKPSLEGTPEEGEGADGTSQDVVRSPDPIIAREPLPGYKPGDRENSEQQLSVIDIVSQRAFCS